MRGKIGALRRLCEAVSAGGESGVQEPVGKDRVVTLQQTEAKVDSRPWRAEVGDWVEVGTGELVRQYSEASFPSTSDWTRPLREVEEGGLRTEGPGRTGRGSVK